MPAALRERLRRVDVRRDDVDPGEAASGELVDERCRTYDDLAVPRARERLMRGRFGTGTEGVVLRQGHVRDSTRGAFSEAPFENHADAAAGTVCGVLAPEAWTRPRARARCRARTERRRRARLGRGDVEHVSAYRGGPSAKPTCHERPRAPCSGRGDVDPRGRRRAALERLRASTRPRQTRSSPPSGRPWPSCGLRARNRYDHPGRGPQQPEEGERGHPPPALGEAGDR